MCRGDCAVLCCAVLAVLLKILNDNTLVPTVQQKNEKTGKNERKNVKEANKAKKFRHVPEI